MNKIDWSKVDLDELERRYQAGREAAAHVKALEAQMDACMNRVCGHPPFKKDGTPDKRYDCSEGGGWEKFYNEFTTASNELYYQHGSELFKAIGLPLSDEDE